jgi:hypothetical protein
MKPEPLLHAALSFDAIRFLVPDNHRHRDEGRTRQKMNRDGLGEKFSARHREAGKGGGEREEVRLLLFLAPKMFFLSRNISGKN